MLCQQENIECNVNKSYTMPFFFSTVSFCIELIVFWVNELIGQVILFQ